MIGRSHRPVCSIVGACRCLAFKACLIVRATPTNQGTPNSGPESLFQKVPNSIQSSYLLVFFLFLLYIIAALSCTCVSIRSFLRRFVKFPTANMKLLSLAPTLVLLSSASDVYAWGTVSALIKAIYPSFQNPDLCSSIS